MKIGLFTPLFGDKTFLEMLDLVESAGIEAVELGVGAYPGASHVDVERLLASRDARDEFLAELARRNLTLSALSVHGNPLHPNAEIAGAHHDAFVRAVTLAGLMGVRTVNGFSGCPGDCETAKNPNWVTCAWPDEFRDVLDWQWAERVIPYWKEQHRLLETHNVRFAIEMHPGFVVYHNESLLRLRAEVGTRIGANFDPSHLWWQGVDPLVAVRELAEAGALFHCHAKDARIDPQNAGRNGHLDTKSYGDIAKRSWVFRSVGYGHPESWWKDFCSTLRTFGYDDVLSIEHEDGLMSSGEGLRKAVEMLRRCVIQEPAGPMFWAND